MRLPLSPEQLKRTLVGEGLITEEKFDELAADADRKSQSVFDALVAEKVVDAAYLSNLVARTLGVSRIDFNTQKIDPQTVRLLPETISRERQAVLFGREEDGSYDAAMADPSDLETIEFLSQRLKAKIKPFLATSEDLNRGFTVYGRALGHDFQKLIEDNVKASLAGGAKNEAEAAKDLPIVGIVDNILSYAISSRASDIHIEVLEDSMFIRYRIDGILYEVMNVTKTVQPAIAARLKLLAGLKIDEHYEPQDGRFRYQIGNQTVDVRVSVIPTFYGEKVEMRLLESSEKPLSLEELGMTPESIDVINQNLRKAYGMILSCGPTGSGKTTTLYALMNILNKPEVNITTIEDPIEYNMRYVNQTQINPQAKITFASGLRSLLRQDPNIIMVGEIRDAETADISVQAALTGHLLLSSLHTNDAPTAVPRFFDLGVPPFLVGSVLNLVIAQRLVRKICKSCVMSFDAAPDVAATVTNQLRALGVKEESVRAPKILYRGKGCPSCNGTGYRGRLGIYEMFQVTEPIKRIITARDFSLEALQNEARKEGMKTMFEDGLVKVQLAQTTLEEVLRVIRE
ncbi:MAG TPA: GspE/PulE family protein [Candidatus Paceibacterota bacterium]|nr:GspE/PulE family protein [Candidatus Paceibacterota bacterium]